MADETGANCERCGRDVNGTPHRAMCGHPLKPITVDELAGIRETYERGDVAALGYSQVARLLNEIDRLGDLVVAYVERESADAAAGSYAGRAELPRITDGITGDEAYASATLDLTIDEIRTRVAGYAAATARAEQAEAALAEARAQLAKIGRTEDEWGVDCGVLGVLHTSRAEFGMAEKAIKTQQRLMHRLAGEWHVASLDGTARRQERGGGDA